MQQSHRNTAARAACVLLVIIATRASAQDLAPPTLDPNLRVTQYVYSNWQVEDGLPQNSVYAVEQTRDGFLWLGTQEGLVRFDGVRFTVYDTYRTENLPSHSISALLEDSEGGLWLGMDKGGVARFDDGEFTVYAVGEGIPPGGVRSLYEDAEGHIWIGTEGGGLGRLDEDGFTTFTATDGLASNVVLRIKGDRSGALWIGTDSGLSRFADGHFENYTESDGLPGTIVRALHVSDAGAVWIGTDGGISRLRGEQFQRYADLSPRCNGIITDLLEDRRGALWIATREDGVCRMTSSGVQHFDRTSGLSYDNVGVLYEDREGNMWLGTEGGGLNQIRNGKFTVFGMPEGLADDAVYSVFEESDGAIWIGTSTGGLHRLKEGRIRQFTEEDGLSSDFVLTIAEDDAGAIWVGTYYGGLCRLLGASFDCLTTADGLASDFVRTIHRDSRGELWIGTDAGLQRLGDNGFTTYGTDEGLPDAAVMAIEEDERGDLWIGTGNGMARVRDGEIAHVETPALDEMVLAIHEDGQGFLWLGTFGSGLYRFRDGSATRYSTADGLFDDTAIQILEDDGGNLWLGSNKGITRIDRSQFDAYDKGEIATLSPVVFNEADGLRSREANGGTQPAAFKASDGRLWFSTMRGAAVIDPALIVRNPIPPQVVLEDVLVNEVVVAAENGLSVEPESKKFEFRYTALSFVAPEDVSFMYRLDGVDRGWVDAGSRRQAFYTNLKPGHYRFRVRAANNDGVWSSQEATLSFHLEPRFYQTNWFKLLCVLLGSTLAVGVFRVRTRQLSMREKKLAEIVEEQTEALKSQKIELERLNANLEEEVQRQLEQFMHERTRYEHELIQAKRKAEQSAELKATILTNMTHEFRTPLAAILGYGQILAEEITGEHLEFVEHVTSNGQRLLATLDSILELSALENGEINLPSYDVDASSIVTGVASEMSTRASGKGLELRVDMPDRPVIIEGEAVALERIVTKLLENAIKFTEAGSVHVSLDCNGDEVRISVADTGVGIGEAFLPNLFDAFKQESDGLARTYEGTGVGLTVAARLAAMMNGRIEVSSRRHQGSTFTVHFPSITTRAVAPAAY